ncbi:MAG: twin-arginine translocase TatA/TatE family subunit [Acidobacteriota bacterium]|nr:twin-arginine translocase TatA/TatE family subunit [Acidobacteriota bacterium]
MFASPWKDALIVLFIVLLFFGPKRLPALSRSIGESIKEFKGGIAQSSDSDSDSDEVPELPPSSSGAGPAGAAPAASAEQRETSAASEHTNA